MSTDADTTKALEQAHAELLDDPDTHGNVTVRALQKQAGVSTAAASTWLKAHRAALAAPGPIPDDLADLVPLHDLWSRAVELARAEVQSKHAIALADAHDARIKAEEALDTQRRIAAEARAERDRLKEKLAASEAALDDQRKFQEHIRRSAEADRAAREKAEAAAADAERRANAASMDLLTATATIDTLREALTAIGPNDGRAVPAAQ